MVKFDAMFDQLGKKISDVAEATVHKSKELADSAKTNMAISGEEREINKDFMELGRWYYQNYREQPAEGATALVADITARYQQIEMLKASLEKEGNSITITVKPQATETGDHSCPSCGDSIPAGSRFCPQCGQPVEEKEQATE